MISIKKKIIINKILQIQTNELLIDSLNYQLVHRVQVQVNQTKHYGTIDNNHELKHLD